MNSEYELTLNDYIAILKRRALLLCLSFALILGVSLLVAVAIPPVYQSTGTILVESQQISADLVAASNSTYADERIEIIRQRVMTREHLIRITHQRAATAAPREPDSRPDVRLDEKIRVRPRARR